MFKLISILLVTISSLANYLHPTHVWELIIKLLQKKHIQLIFNQNQADAQKWSIRRRKEEVSLGISNYHFQTICPFSYLETDIIQYQDAFDNTFTTPWSDGLFKVFLWKSRVQRIAYLYYGKPNSNNQVTLSNNLISFASTIPAHSDSIS